MALTVYGAMKLEALKNFRLVCGQLGLNRIITRTAILDYEFTSNVAQEFSGQFAPGEFVLSSMLYAHQDDTALLEAVQKLIDLGASALAIKTVFFKVLPETVCRLANEERFPIFLFDNSIFFEDVISEITDSLKASDRLIQISIKLDTLLYGDLFREDIKKISMELNRDFRKYVVVYYGKPKSRDLSLHLEKLYESYQRNKFRSPENLMVGYRDGVMLFISGDHRDPAIFDRRLEDNLICCGLSKSALVLGYSKVYDAVEELDYAVREAVWAQMGAEAASNSGRDAMTTFESLGIYRLLLPLRSSAWCDLYHESFLDPLLNKGTESETELMKTAIAYITCRGNLKQTAETLYVHENTVRYRISNIHKRLCPEANELTFYEQLSAAVRLHVLKTHNRCI